MRKNTFKETVVISLILKYDSEVRHSQLFGRSDLVLIASKLLVGGVWGPPQLDAYATVIVALKRGA